jgi:hypothetical protein
LLRGSREALIPWPSNYDGKGPLNELSQAPDAIRHARQPNRRGRMPLVTRLSARRLAVCALLHAAQ